MEKKYVYRKHLRQPEKIYQGFLAFFLIVFLSIIIVTFQYEMFKDKKDIIFVIGIGFVIFFAITIMISVEFLMLYLVLFRRFKKISLTLNDEGISYSNSKGTKFIKYEDIIGIEFPSIKYTGGWIKIRYKGGNIRVTVVLEEIGDFISSLKNKLDEHEKTNLYDEKKIFSFYKTAKYSDNSWGRLYDNIRKLIIVVLLSICVAFVFSFFNKNIVILKTLAILLGYIVPIIVFFISEIIIGRSEAKHFNQERFTVTERDKVFEAKVYKNCLIFIGILTIVMQLFLLIV